MLHVMNVFIYVCMLLWLAAVWMPSKCEKRKVNLNVTYAKKSSQPDRVVVICLVDQKMRGRKGKESVRSCGESTPAELDI